MTRSGPTGHVRAELPTQPSQGAASYVLHRSLGKRYPRAVRGEGVYLFDDEGRRYLDGSSGALVVNIGHGNARVAAAVAAQLTRLQFAHTSQFTTPVQEELAARLAATAPTGAGSRVLFLNGGSEANDAAIKLVRQHFVERGDPKRWRIVTQAPSYHGATFGAMAISGIAARRKLYEPYLFDVSSIPAPSSYRCPIGSCDATCNGTCVSGLEQELAEVGPESVAAVFVEPVIGAAAGAVALSSAYAERLRELCNTHGILLVADEVMCGAGRTGRFFASEHTALQPDIVLLGKGLGSGYAPVAALIAAAHVVEPIERGSGGFVHGHTYSGHAPGCAAALAVLDELEDHDLIDRAGRAGARLEALLHRLAERHDAVGDVRGRGLMLALELVADSERRTPFPPELRLAQRVGEIAFEEGLIVYPASGHVDGAAGDVVLIGPPFTIADAELDELAEKLDRALALALAGVA